MNEKELSNMLSAAVNAEIARNKHAIEKIDALVREYGRVVANATKQRARLELIVTPEVLPTTKKELPVVFLLRGAIFIVVGDSRMNICKLGVLKDVAQRLESVREQLDHILGKGNIVHSLIALEITDYYGHRLHDEQAVINKKMQQMLRHQVDEYDRSEGWRHPKRDDD